MKWLLLFVSFNVTAQINDKELHFLAGSLSGYYGASLELALTKDVHPYITCVASATLAGTIKELSDKNTTGFNNKDLSVTIAGGILTGTVIYFIKKKHKKRHKFANDR
jgi:hypothetical protein